MSATTTGRRLAAVVLVLGLLAGVVAMHAADGGLHASHAVTAASHASPGVAPAHAEGTAPAHPERTADWPAGQHDGAGTAVLVCLAVVTVAALALATRGGPAVLVPPALRSAGRRAPPPTRRPPADLALLCVLRT